MHIHTPSHWQNLHYFMDLETDSNIFYSLLRQFEETEFKSKAGHLQVPCSLSEGKRSSKGTRAQMYLLVVSYDTTLYKCNLRVGKASLASQSNFTVYHGGGRHSSHCISSYEAENGGCQCSALLLYLFSLEHYPMKWCHPQLGGPSHLSKYNLETLTVKSKGLSAL